MSCFNPSYMKCSIDPYTGALSWTFEGNARYTDPKEYGSYADLQTRGFFYVAIPCRHCLGCHLDYSRTWANRMLLEFEETHKGIFLTLTYRNADLPLTDDGVPTLVKRDWQLFMKRLRQHFKTVRLRFFAAGEYGSRTLRPHYHAIIFGLDLTDLDDLRQIGQNEVGNSYFTSKKIENIWSHGFVLLGTVNAHTCSYVARYVLKKHYKKNLAELCGAAPEFNLSSRRPGIGLGSAEQYLSRMYRDSDYITLRSCDEVHTFPIPKAFLRKCKKSNFFIDFINQLNYDRFNNSNERLASDLEYLGLSFDDYLRLKYNAKLESIKVLPERGNNYETKESKSEDRQEDFYPNGN